MAEVADSPEVTASRTSHYLCTLIQRLGLIALWGFLGMSKALNPSPFLHYISDLLAEPEGAAPYLGWAVIALEITLAVLLLTMRDRAYTKYIASASLLASLVVVAFLLLVASPTDECGCFGRALKATWSTRMVAAGTLMFLSAGLLMDLSSSSSPRVQRR